MKSICRIIVFNLVLVSPLPLWADSDADTPSDQPSAWSRFWHDVKNDWINIGKDARETGTEVGRSFKEEFQDLPEKFRKGFDDARQDFENGTGTPPERRTDR